MALPTKYANVSPPTAMANTSTSSSACKLRGCVSRMPNRHMPGKTTVSMGSTLTMISIKSGFSRRITTKRTQKESSVKIGIISSDE